MFILGGIVPALERDGLALLILSSADRRVIDANAVLARVSGFPEATVRALGLAALTCPETDGETLARLEAAIVSGGELRDEIRLGRADGTSFWFGFSVIPLGDMEGVGPAVLLMGRDITARRRLEREEATITAVLAEVFRSLDVATAVVLPNDRILVANPAYAELTGYAMQELSGLPVDRLTAPESLGEAKVRRADLQRTGRRYRMPLNLLRKDGTVLAVLLYATVVEHAGTRFRVVTLHPEVGPHAGRVARQFVVGQIGFVRLDAVRRAYGERWPQVEGRLMMLAETVIKRRLASGDVYARTRDGAFAIWFARGSETENADRIASITREIRIRVIGELGGEATPDVAGHAAAVPAEGITSPPDRETLGSTLVQRLLARQEELRSEVMAGLEQALSSPRIVVERLAATAAGVTDLLWMSLDPDLRRRIDAAHALAPEEALALADHDLVLLGGAAEAILSRLAAGTRAAAAVPVSYETFASMARRRGFLAACRGLSRPVREHLTPAIDAIPPGTNALRLLEFGQEIAALFGGAGLVAEGPSLPDLPP
ncbi:MAG: PAS domain-containing protein, partial [Acetobacteraceae bacterium]